MNTKPRGLAKGWKTTISIFSLLLLIPGIPCSTMLLFATLAGSGLGDNIVIATVAYTVSLITLTLGGMAWVEARRSLQGKPSANINFPSILMMEGTFIIFLILSLLVQMEDVGFLFIPFIGLVALMPALIALAWFAGGDTTGLTWRRAPLAFGGGVLVQLGLTLMLFLGNSFFYSTYPRHYGDDLMRPLLGDRLTNIFADPNFIYYLIVLTLILPIVQELLKPLVIWLLLPYLNARESFLVGGMVGIGYVTMGAVIATVMNGWLSYNWLAILLIHAMGGVLHPLTTGVMAVGWRKIRQGAPSANTKWATRFGAVVIIHTLWNGSAFLLIELLNLYFRRMLPAEIGLVGYAIAGGALIIMVSLILTTFWAGRLMVESAQPILSIQTSSAPPLILTDRAVAIWAVACFLAIVPTSIIGMVIWG